MRLFLVALLIASVAFVGFRLAEKRAEERTLAAIAGDIAHREISIRCQTRVGELVDVDAHSGWVDFDSEGRPGGKARLDRATCRSLVRLSRGERVADDKASRAVETLAHESYHLAGVQDEAATECYGLQAMRFVAARLGVSPASADAYVRAAVARYPGLPEAYRSVECREGGALDLHPESGVFP